MHSSLILVTVVKTWHLVTGGNRQLVSARIERDRGDGPQEVVPVDALPRVHVPQHHLHPHTVDAFRNNRCFCDASSLLPL